MAYGELQVPGNICPFFLLFYSHMLYKLIADWVNQNRKHETAITREPNLVAWPKKNQDLYSHIRRASLTLLDETIITEKSS